MLLLPAQDAFRRLRSSYDDLHLNYGLDQKGMSLYYSTRGPLLHKLPSKRDELCFLLQIQTKRCARHPQKYHGAVTSDFRLL